MTLAVALVFVVGTLAVPDAVRGVQDRFKQHDTEGRFQEVLYTVPFFAIAHYEYPMLGQGTGMQQNARMALQPGWSWVEESETGRQLIELGPVGYLLVWVSKLGLIVALFRAGRALRSRGHRPLAGAAFALSLLTALGAIVMDHVYQALLFVACGLLLGALTDSDRR